MSRLGLLLIVILFLASIIIASLSCERIDAGHEGILIKKYGSSKGVQDGITLITGTNFINPITERVVEFPIFMQTADYNPFTINAKDGSLFTVDPTISFSVIPGKSPHIYSKYRRELEQITTTALYNYTKDAFRIQMNKFTTDELISQRQTFEAQVQNNLDSVLRLDGFKLEQMTSGLQYPQSIVDAINSKNTAIQNGMRLENELKNEEINAKKKLIMAEADSKANHLRQQSLTPLLIQKMFIDKWNGSTPLYGQSPINFKNVDK